MYSKKVCVVGDKDLILAFKAIGLEVFACNHKDECEKLIKKISKDYAVIFLTEDLAIQIPEVLNKYKAQAYPAIIPIPYSDGTNGFGIQGIKNDVEKAIGTDILFNSEE